MGRPRHDFYGFITDSVGKFYFVTYDTFGNPIVNKQATPIPLKSNAINLTGLQTEFGTNKDYFSLVRSVQYPLRFINDAAAILRSIDYQQNGYNSVAYYTLIKYDPSTGLYKLHYTGRFDFNKKSDKPKEGYTINTTDYTAWGILSQNEDIEYQVICSAANPKAIRVLYDGITLLARYVYQPVVTGLLANGHETFYLTMPEVLISTEGDSSGIIAQSTDYVNDYASPQAFMAANISVYEFKTAYETTIRIQGTKSFYLTNTVGPDSFSLLFYYYRSTDTALPDDLPAERKLYEHSFTGEFTNRMISFSVDQTFDLAEGERIIFGCRVTALHYLIQVTPLITPILSNTIISTSTSTQPTIAYAIRPLDLIQDLVNKATNGQYTVNSSFFAENQNKVVTCGDALRQLSTAVITMSVKSWFKTYDVQEFLAFRLINGELWIEKADEVYKTGSELFDLGEVIDLIVTQSYEYLYNQIEVGCRTQDYRRASGRLEFNATNKFSIKSNDVKNTLNLISPTRTDGFGQEFIRLDYQGGSTKDNEGDKANFLVAISDETGGAETIVENFVNVTVNDAPLAPIITSPQNNDWINYSSPVIRGRCAPGQNVNIYADHVLDGSTTADSNGNWSYELVTVLVPYEASGGVVINDGIHVITATFTDETGTVETLTINISDTTISNAILYPLENDSLYNNKPLIKGTAQEGTSIDLYIDEVFIANVIADKSCKWEYQSEVILNGDHVLRANTQTVNFSVNSFTDVPIITSFFDGFQITTGLPLVEGVAIPGTIVYLWLDYFSGLSVGSDVADGNGNWAIQLFPLLEPDGFTVLTPIPNGTHVLSTDLVIKGTVIRVIGYKLDRPDYDSITGVTDNTVFNTTLSPMRNMLARKSFFASIGVQQLNQSIVFQKGEKNQSLSTLLDGVLIKENSDIKFNSLGNPLFLPINVAFKTKVPETFDSILRAFSSGGHIKLSYQGNDIYALPIGTMSMADITRDLQDWKLLLSPLTSLLTLLNLQKDGLSIATMTNSFYRSNYNRLHFVKYNYTKPAKYNAVEIYDDWFENRNSRWTDNPIYVDKFLNSEIITDQIIANGLSDVTLAMYRCLDGKQIDTFAYSVVTPAPIPFPDVVLETTVNLSDYPEDQYFFVIFSDGVARCISERIETFDELPNTMLLECSNSTNKTGCIFSNGFKSIHRVEGLVAKWRPDISTTVYEDEIGDTGLLHSVASKKRTIFIGNPAGLPDYKYLKISQAILLDTVVIEGVEYVIEKDTKLEPIDQYDGYPMYAFKFDAKAADNNNDAVFAGGDDSELNGVTLVVDAAAFGIGGGGVVDIIVENE